MGLAANDLLAEGTMTDSIADELARVGLEQVTTEPMKFPRMVDENTDQMWLRCQVDGVERECEITIGQAWAMVFTLLAWLAKAVRR